MNEVKYEVAFIENGIGSVENTIVNLKGLTELTLEIARENEFVMREDKNWIHFINRGEKREDGYLLDAFKSDLKEDTLFAICSEILGVQNILILRIASTHKTRIKFSAVYPGSDDDNDQVLHQMGYEGSTVSMFEIYVDDKHVANYGSIVYGKQTVYCNIENTDSLKLVPIEEGEEYRLHKEPQTLKRAQYLQKQDGVEYLIYSDNCWLQDYYETPYGIDLTGACLELDACAEVAHDTISESLELGYELIELISNAASKVNKEEAAL